MSSVKISDRLTHFMCFLLSGQAGTWLALWLTEALLTALYKKQGDIRPIAAGELLRRLPNRLCSIAAQSFPLPKLVLVLTKGRLEAAIHCLSTFIESHVDNQNLCCPTCTCFSSGAISVVSMVI